MSMNSQRTAAIFSILALAGLAGIAAHQPPTELHQVDGHWTAWDPPTSFPEGAQVHTVETGDTLWDLAGRLYGNPYLWPQIWEQNRYVLDAHWIYPGDPLVVGFEVTPIEDVLAASDAVEDDDDTEAGLRLARGASAPTALGSEDDIQCSGYIGELEEEFPRRIIGSEYESLSPNLVGTQQSNYDSLLGETGTVKIDLALGDIVYVDGGRQADLLPGDLFTVVIPRETVKHPASGTAIGRFYSFVGRVRVLSVQEETAIAEIVHGCMPVRVGAALTPYVPEPVPLARRTLLTGINDPVSSEVLETAPMIVRSERQLVSIGRDHLVYLDLGEEAGVTPGDIYSIYRMNRKGHPPVVIGELGILSVRDRSSVAKVLESRYTVHVGDRIDPKR
ncbi:MAG: LysM peptidoglycan-binding domain-containing protein [Thermoanaerobaculia bacterium]